jgi:predicted nuclease of predicted toxin-antitoxin system
LRVLLDENLRRKLTRFFGSDTETVTVAERGCKGLKNGELLAVAEAEFDALVTADRRIPRQQDLSRFDLTVVILEAKSNTLEDLAPLAERASEALRSAPRGAAVRVASGST